MILKRDALMAQNLKLLGFSSASMGATTTVRGGFGSSAGNAQATEVHPNMFDRPNEKVLFRVLHFLLLKLKPHAAQVPIRVYCCELCYVDIVYFICLSDHSMPVWLFLFRSFFGVCRNFAFAGRSQHLRTKRASRKLFRYEERWIVWVQIRVLTRTWWACSNVCARSSCMNLRSKATCQWDPARRLGSTLDAG